MVRAVLEELEAPAPRRRFTVGINDDVTRLSLATDASFTLPSDGTIGAVFYGLGSDGTVSSNKATIKIIGEKTGQHCQGHFVYDSKKSGSMTTSFLRFGPKPIRSTYVIEQADFVAVHDAGLFSRLDVLERAAPGAAVLIQSSEPRERVFASLPEEAQRTLLERKCRLYAIDATAIAERSGLGRRINTIMQVCFFSLARVMPLGDALEAIKHSVVETWGKRGPEIVRRNLAAIDHALAGLTEIPLPDAVIPGPRRRRAARPDAAHPASAFVQRVTEQLLEGKGDLLPVSAFPVDGTWPTGTAGFEKRGIAHTIPIWEPDLCIQCNRCAVICPHTAIRTKVSEPAAKEGAPAAFRFVPERFHKELEGLDFSLQVAPEDCTGCGLCVEVCPAKDKTLPKKRAINMAPFSEHVERERAAFEAFLQVPDVPKTRIPRDPKMLGILQPLFEFSGACAGCGETPYIKLLTQLFGDRLMIANATGCSSIYGGNLPTTPYTTDRNGRGPAWANSLFEDNAEFGLGMRIGADVQTSRARALVQALPLPDGLSARLLAACTDDEGEIAARRAHVAQLKEWLAPRTDDASRELLAIADALVPRAVWLVGGDGWAYDIGYGGLDHVLASGANVKVLVLDTEVYSNTGGQQSKATPLGAIAKFASAGKETRKKDLGLLAMSYGHVYVASVGIQAKSAQTMQAFLEAERYQGPALILAHSPCIAHGYDLIDSPAHQKNAIESGAWPLFRYDPRRTERGEAPLILDADPGTLPLRRYMEAEARFRMVELRDPERYKMLVDKAERAVKERHEMYAQLARIQLAPNAKSGSSHAAPPAPPAPPPAPPAPPAAHKGGRDG
jgi:pyruvate-ferredoxin/flavodoxin oxidoreductase